MKGHKENHRRRESHDQGPRPAPPEGWAAQGGHRRPLLRVGVRSGQTQNLPFQLDRASLFSSSPCTWPLSLLSHKISLSARLLGRIQLPKHWDPEGGLPIAHSGFFFPSGSVSSHSRKMPICQRESHARGSSSIKYVRVRGRR